MKPEDLEGIIPAVVLPMRKDFSIDLDVFKQYIDWVIDQGASGIAVNVDTGEGPYLDFEERIQIIKSTKDVVGSRCFIVAGIGGPGTSSAVRNAKAAHDAGADALLVFPTPAFLNDPLNPQVICSYHQAIAETSKLPIIVFQLGPIFGGDNYPAHALAKVLEVPQSYWDKRCVFRRSKILAYQRCCI